MTRGARRAVTFLIAAAIAIVAALMAWDILEMSISSD